MRSVYILSCCLISMAWAQHAAAQQPPAPPPPPPTEVTVPTVTATGHFFSRHEWREGYSLTPATAPDGSDVVRYRARLGLHTTPIQLTKSLDMSAHFVPQAAGNWSIGGDTLDNPQVGIQEGYINLLSDRLSVQVGRFEMAYGEHLVIGSVPWHPVGRAFDGARLRANWGVKDAWVDVFFTSISEGLDNATATLSEPIGAGDTYFTGVYAALGPMLSEGVALDVYALARIWPASDVPAPVTDPPTVPALAPTSQSTAAEVTLGARSKASLNGGLFDYRVEAGLQAGKRRSPKSTDGVIDTLAWHADAELGSTIPNSGMRVAVEGLIASGDDPNTTDKDEGFNQLYPTAHAFLGLMDVVGGRSNVASGVLHLQWKQPWLRVLLDVHGFWRLEVPDGQDTYFGTEADLNLIYPLGKNLTLRALYGQFIPNQRDSFDDHLHYTELEFNASF